MANRKFTRSAAGYNALYYLEGGVYCIANCNGIRRGAGLRRSGAGRRAQSKMWEFEVLKRNSGMSGVFAGYSSKKRRGGGTGTASTAVAVPLLWRMRLSRTKIGAIL